MTPTEARKFGRKKILKATVITIIMLLVIFFYMETRGDFANGFLFFLEAMANIHLIIILGILFALSYVFGGLAGKEIILSHKNYLWTAIKYCLAIMLAIILYAAVIGVAKDGNYQTRNYLRLLTTYFLTPLLKTGSITIIPLSAIWIWATNKMKLVSCRENK